MVKRKRGIAGINLTPRMRIALGTFTSLMVSLVLAGVFALLIVNGTVPENGVVYGVIIIHLIASAAGSMLAGGERQKGLISSGIVGLVYLGILLASGIMFFDGVANVAAGIASVAVGCGVSVLLKMKGSPRKTYGRRRYSC